jgi:hypothetical protein
VRDFQINQYRNSKVVICGVASLLDFNSAEISLQVGGGNIVIGGQDLIIERFDENEIIIVGKIGRVETNVRG